MQNLETIPTALTSMVSAVFSALTIEVSAEKSVSISQVIVMARGLMIVCNNMRATLTSQVSKQLLDTLSGSLATRFHQIEQHVIYSRATFLDPRSKKNGFHDNQSVARVREWVTADVSGLINDVNRAAADNPKTAAAPSITGQATDLDDDLIWQDFDKRTAAVHTTPLSSALIEVRQFFEEPNIDRKDDPLSWWKLHSLIYPCLSRIAKKNLGMMATSVPSEIIFSKTGQLISERRSRLKAKNVEMLIFLNANLQMFK